MQRRIEIAFLLILMLLPGCGGGSGTITPPPPPPPPPVQVPPPVMLRTLYRVLVNGTDRMTTFGPSERSTFPLEAQVYYVADAQASDRIVLNRMVNAGAVDHADAVGPLNGYSIDEVLGYPWSALSLLGLTPILEGFNNLTGDYAMLAPPENLSGYTSQPLAAYGYPRYGNEGEVLLKLSAGGVTVESNAVAGGVVWHWFWNGVQFINNSDYGRQIQAAFYYPPDFNNDDPNEAGDYYHRDNPITAHGSPLLRFENQGNTQYTRAVPLNWDPTVFGGDPDHPIIWNQIVLGKDLTLNFNNMGSVAKYTTHLVLPTATMGNLADPAIYLRSNFNRFYIYDAQAKILTEVTSEMPSGCGTFHGYFYSPSFGGTIISDASGANAMGAYGVDDANGGSVNYFFMANFICSGDGPGESAGDTTTLGPVKGGQGGEDDNFVFPAGESTYNVYLISDLLQNVTTQMDRLYTMGVR
jgi:hypothetical protein